MDEIQVVSTSSQHEWEVQHVVVTGTGTGSVAGHFTLSWNGQGPSRAMPFDEYEEYVEVGGGNLSPCDLCCPCARALRVCPCACASDTRCARRVI